MESVHNITIEKQPFEKFHDTICQKERFKGKYYEFGEEEIKTEFELLKYTKKGKSVYEVKLTSDVNPDIEDFVKKNILNHV